MATQPVPAVDSDDLWADVESPGSRRLLQAALECFARRGYHAATTREIAEGGGLSPGGVYVHYRSKLELLYAITLAGHRSSLRAVEEALPTADTPSERIRSIVRALARWHVDHQELARVVSYEQAGLPERYHKTLRPLRRRFFEMVEDELLLGQSTGEFKLVDTALTARALLSLCTDIARWYRPGHGPDAAELADAYADMAIRLVGG